MANFIDPISFVADRQGVPIARAAYRFFAGRSDVPLVVYRDAARTSAHPPRIETDFAGRRPAIWLPLASPSIPTYRVRVEDGFGGLLFEVDDLPLPASGSSSAAAAASLVTLVDAGTELSISLTPSTMVGILSVNASAADVRVRLPELTTLSPGQSIEIVQVGTGAAVVVEHPSGAAIIEGRSVWPISRHNERARFVSTATDFRMITDAYDGPVFVAVARSLSVPPSPASGALYLAGVTAGIWTAERLYRADGLGGWIDVPLSAGMLALVTGELVSSSPRPYCFNGTSWVPWTPFQGTAEVMVLHHEQPSGTPGGIPVYNAWTRTDLNVSVENSIVGAVLDDGRVTLPAGTYDGYVVRSLAAAGACAVRLHSPASSKGIRSLNHYFQGSHVSLDEVSNNIVEGAAGVGDVQIEIRAGGSVPAHGSLHLTTADTFELQYFANQPVGGGKNIDLGAPLSTGDPEVYAVVVLRKR